jgi:outer membrane protein OmpA-like peptidoglycan-associated protein
VQMAEDSRAIAVKRQDEEAVNAARLRAAEREANAENGRAAAQSETDRVKRDAEMARLKAQRDNERLTREKDAQAAASQADADRLKMQNEARETAAATEADRLKRENDQQRASSQADAERAKRESDALIAAAGTDADRLKVQNEARETAAATEADRLKRENDQQRASTQAELENASKARLRLETEKAELRVNLLAQFNAILQTRDTPRGLIVNMSDVLFDTGKYSLRSAAREKLAKLAGIVSGHPGLTLAVEGYTDSVGGDEYNQQLSEHRSDGVRDYLTQQGMASGSVTAKGFGKTQPVATNATAEGRQQNRRVELVISGEVIGTVIGTPLAIR